VQFDPPPDPPDLAVLLWQTKLFNHWTGASLSPEQVAEYDPLVFQVMGMVAQGMDPPRVK